MTRTFATPSAELTELAAVLAKGYLRVVHDAQNLGTFVPEEPQNALDVSRPESPHGGQETGGNGGGQRDP